MAGTLWVGDGKHPLCSETCAEIYAASEMDAEFDYDAGHYVQTGGWIEDGYEPCDFERGETCKVCKKEVSGT